MAYYKKLKWDSDLFGYGVAKINSINLTSDNLSKILKYLADEGIKLVYCSMDPEEKFLNNIAIANRGILVDKKITYIRTLSKTRFDKSELIYSAINHPASPEIISLAFQSGSYSRFRNDVHFKNNEFELLYTAWIVNSLNGKIAKDVLIYKDKIDLGLITIGIKNNRCDIGLLAIDENMRGKSIGTFLINAAFEKCKELGYNIIQVVTQQTNIGACTFYEKMGFEKEKEENIYHFWL